MTRRNTHSGSEERDPVVLARAGIRIAALATAAVLTLTLAGCSQGTSAEPTQPTTSIEEVEEVKEATDNGDDTGGRVATYPEWMSDEFIAHIEKTCPNYQHQLYVEDSELPDGFPELPVNTDDWTVSRASLSAGLYDTPDALWLTLGEIATTYEETVEAYTAAGWTIVPEAEKKEEFSWSTEFTRSGEELNHQYEFIIVSCAGIVTISFHTQPSR